MPNLSDALASAAADAAIAAIDADAAAGYVEFYTGSLPADLASSPGGSDTLLLTVPLAYPSAPASTAGVADFDITPPPSGTVAADGSPGYCVFYSNGGTKVMVAQVGLYTDPAAEVVVSSLTWLTGETVDMGASTLTMPTG